METPSGAEIFVANSEALSRLGDDQLVPHAVPAANLYCCAASSSRLFVGGLPHGIAYSDDAGATWGASWLDGVEAPAVCIAPDPRANGVLLAESDGGILRSTDNGASWTVCQSRLAQLQRLGARVGTAYLSRRIPGVGDRLRRDRRGCFPVVDAVGDAVLAFKEGVQVLAVRPIWADDGIVLVGTEESGLFYSVDRGHHFAPVADAPTQIDALAVVPSGWLLTNNAGLWASADGWHWSLVDNTIPALVLLIANEAVLAGGEFGLTPVALPDLIHADPAPTR